MSSKNLFPIIDAWAQPLHREAFAQMPEVVRLLQQSGSAHLLNITLMPAPTTRLARFVNVSCLFLRVTPEEKEFVSISVQDDEAIDFSRIRCPLCRWRPDAACRWVCGDCDYPEYFYAGCGTWWNTFATGGLCPGCHHQWRWTSCLSCEGWSRHEEWYEKA